MKPRLHLDDFLRAAKMIDSERIACCPALSFVSIEDGREYTSAERLAFWRLIPEAENSGTRFFGTISDPANQRTRVLALLLAREFFRSETI